MNLAIEKLQQAISLLSIENSSVKMSIGIGITTHNRYEVFKHSFAEITRLSEGCKIVVVDDASDQPVIEATYRFETNVGIARAKNKCFELLEDCEHIFLIDDDTYPIKEGWYNQYVTSGHAHLMYIFKDFATGRMLDDTILLYKDSKINAWSHARGCMLYFKRECLERVGGMNPVFDKWGWEHVNLSERIYHAGLTQFKYADVINSHELFYSADEHETVETTVNGFTRSEMINRNRPIYESLKGKSDFVAFKQKRDIILTSYFTGVQDPQRNDNWVANIDDMQFLFVSLNNQKLVVLHDCFDGLTELPFVEFEKVETFINPYFQRWISYRNYLMNHRDDLGNVFCIDATDVELLRNPFEEMQPGKLYVGDEVEILSCEWITKHHQHPELSSFINEHPKLQLLNAGIIGGPVDILIDFIQKLLDFYFTSLSDAFFHAGRPDAGLTDMAVFNYVARTWFYPQLEHGVQVNTRFKANERNNISWFKHK